jgi:hypothetical protein
MFTRFAGVLPILFVFGCGEADDKTESKATNEAASGNAAIAPMPTVARPASLASVKVSEFESKVRELVSSFYENKASELTQSNDLSVCIDSLETAVEKGGLRMRVLAQLSKCAEQWQITEDMTQASSQDVFDSILVCDGLDPEKYAGVNTIETYKAVMKACAESKTTKRIFYSKTTIDFEELVDDTKTATTKIVSESSSQGADGSFCESSVAPLSSAASGCRLTEVETRTRVEAASGESNVVITYSELLAKDVTFLTAGDRYPASGSASVVVNDWTGALVFKGSSTAPTLSASNGAETVEDRPMGDTTAAAAP